MIKKFENFDEELLDATTLIQILEQIYDDLDDVDVYLSTAGGFAQPLEEWNKNKDGFRFSNLYDADLNWKLSNTYIFFSIFLIVSFIYFLCSIIVLRRDFIHKIQYLKESHRINIIN